MIKKKFKDMKKSFLYIFKTIKSILINEGYRIGQLLADIKFTIYNFFHPFYTLFRFKFYFLYLKFKI